MTGMVKLAVESRWALAGGVEWAGKRKRQGEGEWKMRRASDEGGGAHSNLLELEVGRAGRKRWGW